MRSKPLFTRKFLDFHKYVWHFDDNRRSDIYQMLNDARSKDKNKIIILQSTKEIDAFIEDLNG